MEEIWSRKLSISWYQSVNSLVPDSAWLGLWIIWAVQPTSGTGQSFLSKKISNSSLQNIKYLPIFLIFPLYLSKNIWQKMYGIKAFILFLTFLFIITKLCVWFFSSFNIFFTLWAKNTTKLGVISKQIRNGGTNFEIGTENFV